MQHEWQWRRARGQIDFIGSLESYIENSSIIVQTDYQGTILHANPSGLTYFNTTLDNLRTLNLYDFVREDGHGVLRNLLSLQQFVQPKIYQGLYLKGLPSSMTIKYYRHHSIDTTMIFFSPPDISGELIQGQEEQKWAERLQIMLFGMNHELKTPLATAKGYLDLLHLTKSYNEIHTEAALEALSKMSAILNDMTTPMRDLADPPGNQINLAHAIESYTKTMSYIEPTKRYVGSFEADIEAASNKYVSLSRPRFYQILTNLFDNSIRASAHHDTEAHISIQTYCCDKPHHGPCLVMAFSDNGIGMDDATKRKMFAPYFTTREQDTGSGLGSYFVYQFVLDAGGRVEVDSELGEGTTIYLHLPYMTKD